MLTTRSPAKGGHAMLSRKGAMDIRDRAGGRLTGAGSRNPKRHPVSTVLARRWRMAAGRMIGRERNGAQI
jgi:hypothetical protein